jgi:hypothetical protein
MRIEGRYQVSQCEEVTGGTNGGIRREGRTILAEPVELANLAQSWSTEITSTHNLSSQGARVTTQRVWEPGSFVLLKSLHGDFWARARVVYWRSFLSSRASIGLEFIVHGGHWPVRN